MMSMCGCTTPATKELSSSSHLITEIQRLQAKKNHGYDGMAEPKCSTLSFVIKGKNCCELQSWTLILPQVKTSQEALAKSSTSKEGVSCPHL